MDRKNIVFNQLKKKCYVWFFHQTFQTPVGCLSYYICIKVFLLQIFVLLILRLLLIERYFMNKIALKFTLLGIPNKVRFILRYIFMTGNSGLFYLQHWIVNLRRNLSYYQFLYFYLEVNIIQNLKRKEMEPLWDHFVVRLSVHLSRSRGDIKLKWISNIQVCGPLERRKKLSSWINRIKIYWRLCIDYGAFTMKLET